MATSAPVLQKRENWSIKLKMTLKEKSVNNFSPFLPQTQNCTHKRVVTSKSKPTYDALLLGKLTTTRIQQPSFKFALIKANLKEKIKK